ncbi:hypothetical protein QTP88_010285 [Uroleucon formosanum]
MIIMTGWNIVKGHIDQAFISKGYSNWKDACNAFKSHVKKVCHANCVESWSVFKSGISIDVQLKVQNELDLKNREKDRLHNREVLKRLINIVILLTKTGRSFRGHDESSKSMNKGPFLETVNLLKKYDPIIQAHLEKSPKNAQYLSSKIQDDLFKSLHNVIFQLILKKLNEKKVLIMADETSDCVSVCFDGAASMVGKISGVNQSAKNKTKLRFTMKQDRLDDLMLPYMEQSLANNIDVENVIKKFKKS